MTRIAKYAESAFEIHNGDLVYPSEDASRLFHYKQRRTIRPRSDVRDAPARRKKPNDTAVEHRNLSLTERVVNLQRGNTDFETNLPAYTIREEKLESDNRPLPSPSMEESVQRIHGDKTRETYRRIEARNRDHAVSADIRAQMREGAKRRLEKAAKAFPEIQKKLETGERFSEVEIALIARAVRVIELD